MTAGSLEKPLQESQSPAVQNLAPVSALTTLSAGSFLLHLADLNSQRIKAYVTAEPTTSILMLQSISQTKQFDKRAEVYNESVSCETVRPSCLLGDPLPQSKQGPCPARQRPSQRAWLGRGAAAT